MALTVVEQAGLSDVGRQREANEDNYVIAPPLFAVADGMGGAQAGEVASATAAAVFEEPHAGGQQPEAALTRLTQDANRQIFDKSRRDPALRGMGTTLTAAMVWSEGVSVGHVGDSRAYRFRDGELEQLTHDHSLVAELQRSGQLSAEAAESHPQRSIITRALGPEPEVEVDAHTHAARPGDVYLICSDGLTGMVGDADIAAILRGAGPLRDAARDLVRAANQSGGKDNITVVLFRLGEGEPPVADQDTLAGQETIHQGLNADDVHAAVQDQERKGRTATEAVAAPRARSRGRDRPPKRSALYRLTRVVVVLAVLAAIGVGATLGARSVYFLGTDDAGLVTLYRGVPYQLPLGVNLYSSEYTSSVPAGALSRARRERLLDHQWRKRDDASDLVRQLERGTLDTSDR